MSRISIRMLINQHSKFNNMFPVFFEIPLMKNSTHLFQLSYLEKSQIPLAIAISEVLVSYSHFRNYL